MGPPHQQSLVPSEASACYRTNRPCLVVAAAAIAVLLVVHNRQQCLRRNRAPSRCRTMVNQIWPRSLRGCSSTRAAVVTMAAVVAPIGSPDITVWEVQGRFLPPGCTLFVGGLLYVVIRFAGCLCALLLGICCTGKLHKANHAKIIFPCSVDWIGHRQWHRVVQTLERIISERCEAPHRTFNRRNRYPGKTILSVWEILLLFTYYVFIN